MLCSKHDSGQPYVWVYKRSAQNTHTHHSGQPHVWVDNRSAPNTHTRLWPTLCMGVSATVQQTLCRCCAASTTLANPMYGWITVLHRTHTHTRLWPTVRARISIVSGQPYIQVGLARTVYVHRVLYHGMLWPYIRWVESAKNTVYIHRTCIWLRPTLHINVHMSCCACVMLCSVCGAYLWWCRLPSRPVQHFGH